MMRLVPSLRRGPALIFGLILILLAGCADRPSFRIGYIEGQPDSALMAHTVAETLRQAGARGVLAPCDTLVACGRQLQAGDIDLMPEYSGSARVFLRSRELGDGALSAARRALGEVGLSVTPGLGFDAPYVLLVQGERAVEQDLTGIGDLSQLDQPRFAVPPGYARQPGDGLFALARRYGLTLDAAQVQELRRPSERIAELLAGRVEVAVLRAPYVDTAAALRALDDELSFYPRYEAAVVIGRSAQQHVDFVERALQPLFGELAAHQIQPLLVEQVLQGRDPGTLARQLLVDEGVLDASKPGVRRPEMVIAHAVGPSRDELGGRALLALRSAFPDRPVELTPRSDPQGALADGEASLALLYTSDFFRVGWDGSFAGRDPRVEAIAAVGRRAFVLLVRRAAMEQGRNPLALRAGTQPGWTAAGRVGARLLALNGGRPAVRASPGQLVSALQDGELDAAVVMLTAETRAALRELEGNAVRVEGLTRWLAAPPFFLNQEVLPAEAVPGALAPIDTVSMQLVIAGPALQGRTGAVHGGPSAAVATGGLPLPLREARALAAAVETQEPVDPVLPSFRDRQAAAERRPGPRSAWIETTIVLAAILFMAWAFLLLVRPQRRP
jgi:glycine betaine/choline ABC-type transport system substrate-binding protein